MHTCRRCAKFVLGLEPALVDVRLEPTDSASADLFDVNDLQ